MLDKLLGDFLHLWNLQGSSSLAGLAALGGKRRLGLDTQRTLLDHRQLVTTHVS